MKLTRFGGAVGAFAFVAAAALRPIPYEEPGGENGCNIYDGDWCYAECPSAQFAQDECNAYSPNQNCFATVASSCSPLTNCNGTGRNYQLHCGYIGHP